jgi:hypothetical protein
MITDSLATFFDETALTLGVATPSKAVNVPALAGRLDSEIHFFIKFGGTVAASKTGSVTVVFQEAADLAFTTPVALPSPPAWTLAVGANEVFEFFDIPKSAKRPFFRLLVTAASTDTACVVKIQSGVTMDVFAGYDKTQYRDKGKVV